MLSRWLIAVLISLVAVPAALYFMGGIIIGPYEGESGLVGLMGTIYVDAMRGHLSAWVLLLAPVLLAIIWVAYARIKRFIPA